MKRAVNLYFLIILSLALFSCKSKESSTALSTKQFITADSIRFSGLSEKYSAEYIEYKGEKILFSSLSIIKPFNNNRYVIYDGAYGIYIADNKLNIEKHINLKNKDYYFIGAIKDLAFSGNYIFLLDNSFILKRLDVLNENISEIEISSKQLGNYSIYNLNSISSFGNKLVLSPMLYMSFPKETICLGILIDNEGVIERGLLIDKSIGDINTWKLSGDFIYTSQIGTDLLICFNTSRKVYKFNEAGEFKGDYSLPIDKRFYFEPHMEQIVSEKGGIKATGNQITFTPINNNSLQIDNGGNLYFIMFQGQFGKQKLVRMDPNMQIKDETVITTINNCCYKMIISNNSILIHNGNKIHLFN